MSMKRKPYNPLPQLIEFASQLRFEDLPQDVVHETKCRVIDALGCSLGSLSDPRVERLREVQFSSPLVSHKNAGLTLGSMIPLSLDRAAFLNTTTIRWLDFNDTYLAKEPAHPSDNLGLLLALCGAPIRPVSGKDFITAAVIAYDIQCRLCEAASLRKRGWDHVNYVLISATLAGARLLGLNQREMYDAVAFALSSHGALRQARAGKTISEQKNMAAGDATRGAAWALEKAMGTGFQGPDEIMEGVFGFIKQISGRLDRKAFDDLGKHFFLAETYTKKYPVEYHAQSVVGQALWLRRAIPDLTLSDIKRVIIQTSEATASIIGDESKRRPDTKETADHSIYFAFAAALKEGEMTLRQYRDELYQDPEIRTCMDAIEIKENPAYTDWYQASWDSRRFPSLIQLFLKRHGHCIDNFLPHPHGHPKNPMSDAEVEAKFLSLAEPVWDMGRLTLDVIWNLEKVSSVASIVPRLLAKDRRW